MSSTPCSTSCSLLRACLAAMSGSLILPLAQVVRADTYDWTGATSTAWETATNYSLGGSASAVVPGGTDVVRFNSASYTNSPNLNNAATLGELLFDAGNTGGTAFGTGSNTLTLNGVGGIGMQINAGSGLVNTGFNLTLRLGANQTWHNNSTAAVGFQSNGATNLNGFALKVDGSGNTSLLGTVSGTGGSLTKDGTGTLTLSGTNTYTGGTTITAGTVKLGSNAGLGSSAGAVSVASGAVLDINGRSVTNTNALTLTGTGINSGGALTNTSGTAATYAGLVTLGGDSSIIARSGGITLGNTGTITGSGFNLTVGGSAATSIAGVIGTGTGSLTKQDTGTLTLSGANTYTGATKINGGTLSLTGSINSGSALEFGGGTLSYAATAGGTQTFNGTTLKAGAANIANATSGNTLNLGALTRNAGGLLNVSSLVGTTNTSAAVDSTGILGTWATTGTGTSLTYAAGGGGAAITAYSGGTAAATAANVTATDGATNYNVAAAGTLGAGASVNTLRYTGAAGTIAGALTANGLMNAGTGAVTYSGAITVGANKELVVVGNTQNTTISGAISDNAGGASGLTYGGPSAGSLILTGGHTFTGNITVAGGKLDLRDTVNAYTNSIFLGTGATLDAANTGSSKITISGTISGGGSISKTSGVSNMILTGNNDFTGGTNVSAGALFVGSDTALGTGTLTIGAVGSRFGSADANTRTIANALSLSVGNTQNVSFGAAQGSSNGGVGDLVFTNTGSITGVSGSGTLTVNNGTSVTFSQNFSSGLMTKIGTGTLVLRGNSAYTGITTVRNGTLVAGANALSGGAGAFGNASSAVVLADSGSAATDNVALLTNGAYTVGRAITVNSNNSSGTTTIGGTNAAATTSVFSGAVTLNRNVVLSSLNSGAVTSFTGGISEAGGSRSVTINGGANAGTVRIGGSNTYTGTTTVASGTLELGASNAFADASNFVLGGGTLAVGTFSDAVGTLSLTGNATISLGAGGTFAFADSHLLDWGSNQLSITGTFVDGLSIRFGTDGSGLTGEQLALISINGSEATLNSSGYLVASAIPEPAAYAMMAGSALLAFAVSRRRVRA